MKPSSSGVRLMLRVGIGSLLRREYACWQSLPTGVFGLKNVESLEFDKANAGDSFDLAQSFNSSVGSGCIADDALLRDGDGVDSIDCQRDGEVAGDGGVADDVGLAGGDATRVGEMYVFEIDGGGVREQVGEALGDLDVGGDLDVLLMREGGR